MKLIIENVRTVFTDINQQERTTIKNALTKKDPRTGFSGGSFKPEKVKSEKFYFENKAGLLVFTGILKDIMPLIKGKVTSIENNVKTFGYQNKTYEHDELRKFYNPKFKYVEHQIRALNAMLTKTRGIIKATTSAGKTEIIIAFIKLSGLKTLVIAPKVDLANQIKDRIEKSGLNVGVMTGKTKTYAGEQVCVSTPQMALSMADREFDCIICDECHHCASKTYQDFLKATKAKVMFGFSATPDTNQIDFFKIRQFFGDIIVDINAKELLENDVIVFPEIKFITMSQFNTQDWPTASDLCIMNNAERNNKIKSLCETNPQPALVLIRNIEHGEALNKTIPNSVFLSGSDSNEYRDEIFKKFENKEIPVLIGTIGILSEGVSINAIRTLIIAQGGKSDIISTQSLGRALRKDGDSKTKAVVYDFMDVGNRFTEKHSKQRAVTYAKIGFPVHIEK